MERCPNCGAPARPGAKFCTTCGYRLPTVVPISTSDEPSAVNETASASSWPAPPSTADPVSQAETTSIDVAATSEEQSSSEDVIAMPASTTDVEVTDVEVAAGAETASTDTTSEESTDSILSSSWPSAPGNEPSPWSTNATDTGADDAEAAEKSSPDEIVTEEAVVVPEPASQYEGWSATVVEEIAPDAAAHGTTIARATALLDELRLLLPVLHSGTGGGQNQAVAAELETAVAASDAAASDRQGLRDALNEARDNPRDIQTILALSQQADPAIALLDDHDRLIAAVRQAISALTAPAGDQS